MLKPHEWKENKCPVRSSGSVLCVCFYNADMLFTEAPGGRRLKNLAVPIGIRGHTWGGFPEPMRPSPIGESRLSWFERVKSLKLATLSVECDLCWVRGSPSLPGRWFHHPSGIRKVRPGERGVAAQPCPAGKVFGS